MDKAWSGMSGLVFILVIATLLTWFTAVRMEASNRASADAASLDLHTGMIVGEGL